MEETKPTKFNPNNKKVLTINECIEPIMGITDQKDADQYLHSYVAFLRKTLKAKLLDATIIAGVSIKHYIGLRGDEIRERVDNLFKCDQLVNGVLPDQVHKK